ncbi:peptide chain release factor N(5)-glutamine methyltransferase [Alloscardovia theropitheci]|uniref:Release factor glutamine methyltransferase n=2 Tax=Alloscardovia theropitheci TaxID=2496842 RepID=A0A4R0QRX3_9BIFI|nr:peptide chain release factor N(5)-glutamine methyltransferase [Alloscardovia theropitheci]
MVIAHEVSMLLAESCDKSVADIQAAALLGKTFEQIATLEQRERFISWLDRRAKREPLQHIVGHAPFRFLDLKVGPGVFIPRPETELIIDESLDFIRRQKIESPRIVDLCAGSGALGLSAAQEIPTSTVWAVEISRDAYAYATMNAQQLGIDNYQLLCGDATDPQTLDELDASIDIVMSNPPYIPEKDIPQQIEAREFDPQLALYGASLDGMRIPREIIKRAYALLKTGGLLLMEHDWKQGDDTREFAQAVGFSTAYTRQDFAGKDRFLCVTK